MVEFRYFGHATCPRAVYGCCCSRQSVWAYFVDEQIDAHGYINFTKYTLWGSPNKPIIREVGCEVSLKENLKKRRGSQRYRTLLTHEVYNEFPNLISEIGQHLTVRKLKNV